MDLSLDKQDLEFRDEFEEWLKSHPPTRRPDRSEDWFACRSATARRHNRTAV